MSFSGKLVVITGVGRTGQVGEAIALAFARSGATLALLDLQKTEVEARAAALTEAGFSATSHVANLSDADAARAAAQEVNAMHKERFDDAVHAVVCVAGGFGASGPLDESDPAMWHKQFLINLDTAYATTRAFLPAVRKASGAFLYFAAAAALPEGKSGGIAAYVAAKSGVIAMMRSLAIDERDHGVRANAVAPTQIRTAQNLASMSDKTRYVERESVADVVQFLCSDQARSISGQVITLA